MKAILGGTFDPVHLGHLHAARRVRSVLEIATVTLMLAARPGHRAEPSARIHDRWRMLQLATRQSVGLAPCDLEIARPGPSYTVDTLASLRGGGPLVWLIGRDALADVPSWHRAEELAALCHFVVLDRPGDVDAPRLVPHGFELVDAAAELVARASGALYCLPDAMLDVSASEVRRRIAVGGNASALLPPDVWTYICSQGLYGAESDGAGSRRKERCRQHQ